MNTVVVSDLQDRPEIFFGEISVSATKMVGVFIFFSMSVFLLDLNLANSI